MTIEILERAVKVKESGNGVGACAFGGYIHVFVDEDDAHAIHMMTYDEAEVFATEMLRFVKAAKERLLLRMKAATI